MSKYIKNPINKKLLEMIKSFDEVESIILELDSDNDFMLYINKDKKDSSHVGRVVLEKDKLYQAKDMEYLDHRISLALTRALEYIIENNKPNPDVHDFKKELEREEFKND